MKDKELADKVVALGTGQVLEESDWINEKGDYAIGGNAGSAKWFVRDWRVAGALMERCKTMEIDSIGNPWWFACNVEAGPQPNTYHKAKGESLPRTIIEACVEALETV